MAVGRHRSLMLRYSLVRYTLVVCLVVGYGDSAANNSNVGTLHNPSFTVLPSKLVAADCASQESKSCENCTAYANCVWCFSDKLCVNKTLQDKRGTCKDNDWYTGDCDKPKKEEVLLYVLLACALLLLSVVVLLVLYIFCCKLPRNAAYTPLDTKEPKIRRKRTPLMSKKFKPVGSRTDELKKKYGLE